MITRITDRGMEIDKGNGWEPVNPQKASMSVNGEPIYSYDQQTGILKINERNMPEGALEQMAKALTNAPSEGINIKVSDPFEGSMVFAGVKEIRAFIPGEAGYTESTVPLPTTEEYIAPKRNFFQRAVDRFYQIIGL